MQAGLRNSLSAQAIEMQEHLVVEREKVLQRAEFSNHNQAKNRAALQAQLLQQGFGQAQNLAASRRFN